MPKAKKVEATTETPKNGQRRKPRRKTTLKKAKEPPKRLSQYELRERRWEVQQLRLRGMALRDIAKKLNICIKTAHNDLQAIQAENHDSIDTLKQQQVLAETLARFDNVEQTAWSEYAKDELTPGQRLRALDLVRVCVNDKLKVLMDVGLVHKAESESTVKHVHSLDWSPEMQDAVAQSLLEQQLTTPLLEPVPDDYIDVPTAETETEPDDDAAEET